MLITLVVIFGIIIAIMVIDGIITSKNLTPLADVPSNVRCPECINPEDIEHPLIVTFTGVFFYKACPACERILCQIGLGDLTRIS